MSIAIKKTLKFLHKMIKTELLSKVFRTDEPTGYLDSANGEEVMRLLEGLNNKGTTIVMVTHSPSHAERANRIVHLFDGQIVTEKVKKKI